MHREVPAPRNSLTAYDLMLPCSFEQPRTSSGMSPLRNRLLPVSIASSPTQRELFREAQQAALLRG